MAAIITGVSAYALAGTLTAVGDPIYIAPPSTVVPIIEGQQIFLSKDTYYSYTGVLNQTAYNFTFRYSTREACWYFDIFTTDNLPVILSTKLVVNYPMLDDFRLDNGVTGYFWLAPNLSENVDKIYTDPKLIADYFTLFYFYEV